MKSPAGVALVPGGLDDLRHQWAQRALTVFRTSCPAPRSAPGPIGPRTGPGLGAAAVRRAATVTSDQAAVSLHPRSHWVRVGNGRMSAICYHLSRKSRGSKHAEPLGLRADLHGLPGPVLWIRPGKARVRGRAYPLGRVSYYSRCGASTTGRLETRGSEIAWWLRSCSTSSLRGDNSVFGGGHPTGRSIRIGYATRTGLQYTVIGKLSGPEHRPPGGANMRAIRDRTRANPDQGANPRGETVANTSLKAPNGPGPGWGAQCSGDAARGLSLLI